MSTTRKQSTESQIIYLILIMVGIWIGFRAFMVLIATDEDGFTKAFAVGKIILVLVLFYNRNSIRHLNRNSIIPTVTGLNRVTGALVILLLPLGVLTYFMFTLSHFNEERELRGLYLILMIVVDIALIFTVQYFKRKLENREAKVEYQATEAQFQDYGSSKWTPEEVFIKTNQPNPSDSTGGLWIGAGYFRTKPGHLFSVAPPGEGKGACLIIPNLLIEPVGSYVVTDPKGENACITARAQKQQWKQNVYILDPWDEQQQIGATHGIAASGFNPFDFIRADTEELPDNCEMVAHYLVPHNPEAKDHFWDDRSRSLIKLLMVHILTACKPEDQNFWTLYKYLRNDDASLAELILSMKENKAYDGLVSSGANELEGLIASSSTFTGIMSNAQNATKIFESPKLRKSLERSDFNPSVLSAGKSTVYVVIPERYIQSHSAWLRIVIGLCLKAVNAKPNKRVVFMLDEFAVLGKMDDVTKAYAYGRGQNITMWTFMQSLSQMKQIYGEDGMNQFISNSMVFQAFGLKDQYSKEYVSKMLGNTTRVKNTSSTSDNPSGSSTSYGRDSYDFPLLTPDEVGTTKEIITISEGTKFLIIRAPYFKNMYEGMTISSPYLSKEDKAKLKKGQKIEYYWYSVFKNLADKPPRIYS